MLVRHWSSRAQARRPVSHEDVYGQSSSYRLRRAASTVCGVLSNQNRSELERSHDHNFHESTYPYLLRMRKELDLRNGRQGAQLADRFTFFSRQDIGACCSWYYLRICAYMLVGDCRRSSRTFFIVPDSKTPTKQGGCPIGSTNYSYMIELFGRILTRIG